MKKTKRHESLIPLSREHHYALMLCLRINRGLPIHIADPEWLRSKARQTIQFFELDLQTHFRAEEQILFPAMRDIPQTAALISELCSEHREIETLMKRLQSGEAESIATTLKEFARVLEAHVRKEERLLFPAYEAEISKPAAERVGREMLALIGSALQPRNPDLLKP